MYDAVNMIRNPKMVLVFITRPLYTPYIVKPSIPSPVPELRRLSPETKNTNGKPYLGFGRPKPLALVWVMGEHLKDHGT